MRDFIKENLRIQLEGLLYEVRDDFKKLYSKVRSKITRIYSNEELDTLSNQAKLLAQNNPNKIGSINDGTKYYKFKFTLLPNGKGCKIESIGTSGIDDREFNTSQDGKILILQAKAYSDQVNPEDGGKTIYTPIVVAKIKILADDENIKAIKRFIDGGASYTDADQLDINKDLAVKKTNPNVEYKRNKLDKDKKNNPDFKPKNVTSVDFNPKIDTLKKDLANNIRFLNTAKNIKQDYINKKEPIDPKLEKRIEDLESKIEDLESELDNYGK